MANPDHPRFKHLPYIPPANLVDVLNEQFDYLIAHVEGGTCTSPQECLECQRIGQVMNALLAPFADSTYYATGAVGTSTGGGT